MLSYLGVRKGPDNMKIDPLKLSFDEAFSQMAQRRVLRGFIFPTDFNQK